MHDIWNPWHGCRKISPGCANCYMYTLDKQRGKDGSVIYRTENFAYPLQKDRYGGYIGSHFIKDGRHYRLNSKQEQAEQAFKAGLNFRGRPMQFDLRYAIGIPVTADEYYRPAYDGPHCHACGSRLICNGCSHCGKCG